MRLRVKFRKFGALRFIGHLDVMRFFQKAIRRAEIDIAYTAGFSPHQIMSFAAPLGVGLTSNGEYMDIQVNSLISCEDVKNRLNQASIPGIEIMDVTILPEASANAMASVAAASYTVRFRPGKEPHARLKEAVPGFLAREEILITKKTKKGERQVDLRPGIYELSCTEIQNIPESSSLSSPACVPVFHMLLDASSSGNIKPSQVLSALLSQEGEELSENALMIAREDMFTDMGTEEAHCFVPLNKQTCL